ncbi:MAG: heavy metal translocating P-type ATPase [Desulfobulbaceae bacterium]|jgi:Cd2+/Zn2+-exporting ATPase|nr:heavy metal translocating P-type ATPase [Desulfobulbaceae bacterium]
MSVFAAKSCACGCHGKASCPAPEGPNHQGHSDNPTSQASSDDASARHEITILVVSGCVFALSMIFEARLDAALGPWAVRLAYAIPYLLCGVGIFREAIGEMRKGDFFNEFALMCIATVAAICLGELAEAVGVMLFYRIGEFFQERAAAGSRKSIASLLAAKPSMARLARDGQTCLVQVEDVAVGDIFEIRAGELVALDAQVISGESRIDQSPLTGESLPVRVTPGSAVLAGSINMSGVLLARATSRYIDSHMARILEMVEHAAERKSPTERFISRFARWYTPAVVALAVLVATLPPLILPGASFSAWIYRALILLIISCPCALLISIPLSYFGGIGAASRQGILVKGGNVFDALLQIDTVVFDKTGTLTEGRFAVVALYPAAGLDESALTSAAFIAERHSAHPIAQAIRRHGEELAMKDAEGEPQSLEHPGKGMEVRHDGARYLAGTKAFLQEMGVQPGDCPLPEQPGALVYVARDQQFLGLILAADRIRADARAAISELKSLGLSTFMLTGDHDKPAAWVAAECGIDGFKSGLLPEEKVMALKEIVVKSKNNTTTPEGEPDREAARIAFVGDGVNDAPILAIARVGIAMGGIGSAAAVEAADVVILNDSPAQAANLFKLANKVRVNVWENIALALGIKALVMALGIAGISGLWEAVFADVGVALLAVLNASRLMRK